MSEAMLDITQLPEGAYTRYKRSIYAMCSKNQALPPFEEWVIEYDRETDEAYEVLNRNHPIEYDKRFRIDDTTNVHLFKRKGQEWSCSYCDRSPYGGDGTLTLFEALDKIKLAMP